MKIEITDKKRLIYAVIFCITIVAAHFLWRTVIDTGMENREYKILQANGKDIGLLAKTKDLLWETVTGQKPNRDNTDIKYISVFGYDLSDDFEPICKNTLHSVVPICNIFKPGFEGYESETENGKRYFLRHKKYKNSGFEIVWGCTAIKQIFMFLFIMLTTLGKFHHRMIYFAISIPIIIIFNLLRISAITCMSIEDMSRFAYLHDNIFRIVFYIFLFGLWVIWADVVTKKIYKQ